ncbi:lazarillo protein-like [Scaptodrosophila lebanonensis]|uniref:Lazarillo protein-like n=1 Tax=Drosophila lebanonensis TaxID=7225 RepID=A0A6J2UAR5_DROLE|nr:lazarillo protein-like [Scaptodrosophila lebanonensis]
MLQFGVLGSIVFLNLFWQVSMLLPLPEPCPKNMTAVGDFNMDRFLGRWYAYSMYPKLSGKMPSCMSIWYNKLEDNTHEVNIIELHDKVEFVKSSRRKIINIQTSGSYDVLGSVHNPDGVQMNILYTDYDSFAIRFMCIDDVNSIFSLQYVMIQFRKRNPTAEEAYAAEHLAKKAGIRLKSMKRVNQQGCPNDT